MQLCQKMTAAEGWNDHSYGGEEYDNSENQAYKTTDIGNANSRLCDSVCLYCCSTADD
ncbi:hypothetical protein [Microcoleus sp. FACHB-68]|uniref:hypothetical protein n=1 Tax=Microcoleus sp. FACHB-68 TaxID=2692826 RepID=UPI001688FA92|nr:hypothetical protein [Microcoleus sp. FACHB-68]MBD1936208.1 hypothetical protein [Microcoleus sp. FACHB-68]